MTDKPPSRDVDDDQLPEPEAEERFGRLVGNLVNTPPKPHKGKESLTGAADSKSDKGDGSRAAPRRPA